MASGCLPPPLATARPLPLATFSWDLRCWFMNRVFSSCIAATLAVRRPCSSWAVSSRACVPAWHQEGGGLHPPPVTAPTTPLATSPCAVPLLGAGLPPVSLVHWLPTPLAPPLLPPSGCVDPYLALATARLP